jgi:deoxyribonuclease-4
MKHKAPLIGAHTSAAGGAPNALREGQEIGATTIQFFTSNQKQWHPRTISGEEVEEWNRVKKETGISHVMSHSSYLINLGSPNAEGLAKSREAFRHEIERCHLLDVTYLNFHPGAALDGTEEECLDTIVKSLLGFEQILVKGSTRLLLEATAGQGSCVGQKFEQLGYIIDKVEKKIPIGVCIDTCHIFVAGYDIRDEMSWEETLQKFEKSVGLKHLYALHLNDSVKPFGSRADRHASLGDGQIGMECFKIVMTHPKLRNLPKYLETPDGPPVWKNEIALLKRYADA